MTDRDLCGYCRNTIPARSVSDYFCGPGCQDLWNRERSEPLGGRSGKPHLTWDQQSAQIRATMAELREAFTGLGGAVQQACDAFDRLTDAQETS